VSAVKQDIGARVDALAQALEGDDFVMAVERLADGMSPDERQALQEVLMERAADEEDLQKAVRRRYAEKGWTRRTLARLEGLWRDDRADVLAEAIQAGPDGETTPLGELELLRENPGRAAVVLDELSRHDDARVRAAEARAQQAEAALEAAQTRLARRTAALDRAQDNIDDRERAADERNHLADDRDRIADERDRLADDRERAADERNHLADDRDGVADEHGRPAKDEGSYG